MMCYRDMTFCSDASKCKNAATCHRYFSEAESERAEKWGQSFGVANAPVAFGSFKESCKQWEPKND